MHLTDRDSLDVFNLLWPDPHYPVPVVEVERSDGKSARAPHLVELGESFLYELNFLWQRSTCAPSMEYWFYFTWEIGFGITRMEIAAGDTSVYMGTPVATNLADLPASIQRADIVLLEENESVISMMKELGDFRDAVEALR